MYGSFDLWTVVFVVVIAAALTAAFRRVSTAEMNRGLKALLLVTILLIGGILVWNLSISFATARR